MELPEQLKKPIIRSSKLPKEDNRVEIRKDKSNSKGKMKDLSPDNFYSNKPSPQYAYIPKDTGSVDQN